MILLLAQLLYNIIKRKQINEDDPQYAGIPQQSVPTGDVPAQHLPAERVAEEERVL